MSAIYQNIVNSNRHRLEEVIPLQAPYVVFLDPSSLCNFKCSFCAVHGGEKPPYKRQLMNEALFCKAIDDLKCFSVPIKKVVLGFQGEPLLHPHFPELVRYVKDAGVAEYIEVVTNGSRFEPKLNQRLANAGIDRFRISVEGISAEDYQRIAKVKVDMEQYVNNIRDLHERCASSEVYCKIVDISVPSEEARQRFFNLFGNICDRFFIDRVIPTWPEFDINTVKDFSAADAGVGLHGQVLKDVTICPSPFYTMVVHTDGEICVCCSDWKRELSFGNVSDDALVDVWGNKKMRKFWFSQARGCRNTYAVCRSCLNPVYDCTDYIDPYGEQICAKLVASENGWSEDSDGRQRTAFGGIRNTM